MAAVLGVKIARSPWKGMFLGMQSSRHAGKAVAGGPNRPVVLARRGANLFWTPAAFGGDLKQAVRTLEQSVARYEAEQGRTDWDWTYLETLAVLGQAYQQNDQKPQALAVYQKALRHAPDFAWVKYQLLPKVQ